MLGLARVGSASSESVKFPLKSPKFFNFFPSGQKKSQRVGSKIPRSKAGWPGSVSPRKHVDPSIQLP